MSQFNFKNKSFRGFTLIELLVVIAIIGLLGTIISGPINTARLKARDAKKVADIKNIQTALTQWADDNNGTFPTTLDQLVPRYLDAVPRNTLAAFTPQADKYMYVTYDVGGRVVGYHLAAKLQVTGNPALDTDADCSNRGVAGVAACVTGAAVTNSNFTSNADPGAATVAGPGNNADFTASVTDTAATPCTAAVTDCIYDVRGTF